MAMLNLATKFAPVQRSFELAVEAGFHCAELWTDAAILANWRAVVELAGRFPLRYVVHFPNRKDLPIELMADCVKLYEGLDCRAMVIHQPHFDVYADALQRLKPDIVLAIENHRLTPEKLADWFARTEYLTLDVEHVWKFTLGSPPLEELWETLDPHLKRHGHKLRHVHLPGYCPGYDEHRPMYCNRDFVHGMFDRLDKLQFAGLIVSEIEVEFQTPNDLRMDVLLFDTWHQRQAR